METEILSIMDASIRSATGKGRDPHVIRNLASKMDKANNAATGDEGAERKLRISYDDGSGTASASVFGNVYSDAECRCLSWGLSSDLSTHLLRKNDGGSDHDSCAGSSLVATHALACLPTAVHRAFQKALAIMTSMLSRAPKEIVYLTRETVAKLATSINLGQQGASVDDEQSEKEKASFLSAATTTSARSMSIGAEHTKAIEGAVNSTNNSFTDKEILCKCMLMANGPMPDFCLQWKEGTCVRYRLRDGVMRIDIPRGEPTANSYQNSLVGMGEGATIFKCQKRDPKSRCGPHLCNI